MMTNLSVQSKSDYLQKLQLILLKFIGALNDQCYDIYIVVDLLGSGHYFFALFFIVADLSPALFIMRQQYIFHQRIWRWRILYFAFHPINMLIWPLFVAFRPTVENNKLFNVRLYYSNLIFSNSRRRGKKLISEATSTLNYNYLHQWFSR